MKHCFGLRPNITGFRYPRSYRCRPDRAAWKRIIFRGA